MPNLGPALATLLVTGAPHGKHYPFPWCCLKGRQLEGWREEEEEEEEGEEEAAAAIQFGIVRSDSFLTDRDLSHQALACSPQLKVFCRRLSILGLTEEASLAILGQPESGPKACS